MTIVVSPTSTAVSTSSITYSAFVSLTSTVTWTLATSKKHWHLDIEVVQFNNSGTESYNSFTRDSRQSPERS